VTEGFGNEDHNQLGGKVDKPTREWGRKKKRVTSLRGVNRPVGRRKGTFPLKQGQKGNWVPEERD